ncbi:hypothetical protein [Streptomyces neyagawaensis]|uniref:hypothetical protein n=1 Tax=Streptomyces neyagawaensis TaxID=42238 RepID=UPI0006E14BDB|nr:hypothetical protein [Streptomyces neyagawaensis]MCL6736143.1 hypothetical protein [Streptomyces neyagawaensis]MDE1688426.1 hypothetical protein [Streptomyces neyagawaensis]
MGELSEDDVSLNDLGQGLRDIRARLERRETELSELKGQYGALSGHLNTLRGTTSELATTVNSVNDATVQLRTELDGTKSDVGRLQADFTDFRSQYERDQAVLRAQFELDRITEEWRQKFGNRNRIRSLAGGLVRQLTPKLVRRQVLRTENLRSQVEAHLFHDPDFWLAHATLAVAARLDGDEELELSSMGQAQLLAPGKADLFFALAAARAGDHERAGTWMDGYLQRAVNPDRLGRDFLVVLDAVASRELGDHAHRYARQVMVRWAAEASAGSAAARASVHRWKPQLTKLLLAPGDHYAPLDQVCGARWQDLQEGWRLATVATATLDHLRKEFPPPPDGPAPASSHPYAEAAIDRLIDHLEPDEAALHTKIEWLRRFVDHRGDEAAAREEQELRRQVDAEVMDFGTLLDNAVFKPSQVALGDDARRLALMEVLPNLRVAAEEITAASRRHRQPHIRVAIEHWHTDLPTDPSQPVDARALADDLDADLLARTEEAARKVDRDPVRLFGGTAGGAAVALVTPWLLAEALIWPVVFIGVAIMGWGLMDLSRVPAQRRRIHEDGVLRRRRAQQTLSQVLGQRIRFFSDWNAHLARLEELRVWDPMGK